MEIVILAAILITLLGGGTIALWLIGISVGLWMLAWALAKTCEGFSPAARLLDRACSGPPVIIGRVPAWAWFVLFPLAAALGWFLGGGGR